jgi:hypothetical protein
MENKKYKRFYFTYKGVEIGKLQRGQRYFVDVNRGILHQHSPTLDMKLGYVRRLLHSMETYGTHDAYRFINDLINFRLGNCISTGVNAISIKLNPFDYDLLCHRDCQYTGYFIHCQGRAIKLGPCKSVNQGDIEIIA